MLIQIKLNAGGFLIFNVLIIFYSKMSENLAEIPKSEMS